MFTDRKSINSNSSYALYTAAGQRKYLSTEERARFIKAANTQADSTRLLCLTLLHSGCRLSEALSLTTDNLLVSEQTLLVRSLKKRGQIQMRHIPMPDWLTKELQGYANELFTRLWPWGRTWGWQQVKRVMQRADIQGPPATPRGLRHSFGTHALISGVPLSVVQRWMGHAKLETTAIYTNVLGPEERAMARLMWR